MNKEKFIQYLKNPTRLSELNYQELKTLVVEYPYCQNLRFLLAKKSKLDQSNELEKDLRNAASCVSSRTYLFQRLNDTKPMPRKTSHVIAPENSLEVDNLSSPSKSVETTTNDLIEEEVSIPENLMDTEANSPAEAKGDNAPPSESPPEIKKNEPGNRSSELRISSERVHLAEKAIIPLHDSVDSKNKKVPFLKDLTPLKKIIHQRVIKKAPSIKSSFVENKAPKLDEEEIVPNHRKEETDLVFEKPNLTPPKMFEPPEAETELIELKPSFLEEEAVEVKEEVVEVSLPPLFPVEPAQSTINNIVIVEPKEDEFEEVFPPSFDDDESEIENLKSNIPFEITNEDDFMEEVEVTPSPSPKSNFNSWIKEFKSKKSKKKKEKSQKKKEKPNNQVEEIIKKKKKNKKKGKGSKKLISKIIKSKKKAEKAEELLPKAKVKTLEKIKKQKTKKNKTTIESVEPKVDAVQIEKVKTPEKVKKQKTKKNKIIIESVKSKVDLPPTGKVKTAKNKKKKKTKKNKEQDGTKTFALKSIVENKEIASETLAKVLVEQGSIQKAINMYKRLSLIFPEKSTFFAEEIEKLKKI